MSRRYVTYRRLFFCALVLLAPAARAVGQARVETTVGRDGAGDPGPTYRIARREVVLARHTDGVRAFERLFIVRTDRARAREPADSAGRSTSPDTASARAPAGTGQGQGGAALDVLRLPATANAVVGQGADVSPSQVRYDAPVVSLLTTPPTDTFMVALTYRLPQSTEAFGFETPLATERLVLSVAKGNLRARTEPPLERVRDAGTAERVFERFTADSIAPGVRLVLRIRGGGPGWHERLAVLLATGLGAGAGLAWAWRRRNGAG